MITTITFRYTFPLASTMSFADQVSEAGGKVPLILTPPNPAAPYLTLVSDTTTEDGTNIIRELTYAPTPSLNQLVNPPVATPEQAKALFAGLWRNTLAEALCTLVSETITVA